MAGVFKRVNKKGETLWYATVYLDGRDRQVRLREKRNGANPVDEARARVLAQQVSKTIKSTPAKKRTAARRIIFKTAWAEFMVDQVADKAENTQNDYKFAYEGHFRTAPFARKRVGNITHDDIRDYVKSKLDPDRKPKPLNPHTVNNHTGMLAQFFDFCELQGYWDGAVNPARAMGIRQKLTPSPIVYLREPEHSLLFVEAARSVVDEKYAVLAATLLWTGIRSSEARSLLWSQVCLSNPKHQHLRIETTAVGTSIQPWTKTAAGDRYVGICPTLATMLEHWRAHPLNGTSLQAKTEFGIAASDGLVFPSDAGTIMSPNNYRHRQFKDSREEAHRLDSSFPLGLNVHGCRHSYSMTLYRQGASVYQVAQELGHSKSSLGSTGAYTHAEAERENPIAAAMLEKSIRQATRILAQKRKATSKRASATAPVAAPTPLVKGIAQKSPKAALNANRAAAKPKRTARRARP